MQVEPNQANRAPRTESEVGAVSAAPVPGGAVDIADLKRKSVRGGAVTLASQGVSISIHLVSTVVLARLLSPDDYGIIAMVLVVTSFAGLFRDLGLSPAAIQKEDLTRAQQSNLFWLNVAMGVGLTILVAAASPVVAWFYGRSELRPVTVALSLTFLIGSFGTQHGAMLTRNMQFGRKAAAAIVGQLVCLLVSVVLALWGQSYWALVWGGIAGGLTTTAALLTLSPFRPHAMSRGVGVRDMLKFGANITAFDLVNYFHRNLDNILIGRFWGAGPLGLYSRAYALLLFPIHAIRAPISAVAFPAMSRLQGQPQAFRSYYRRTTAILAFLSMPVTAYLLVAAQPVVNLMLGEEWGGVVPIFAVLAISGFIQPAATLRGTVLLATGQGRRYLYWGILNSVAVSIGFVCGLPWGAIGVATAYAVVNYAILYPSLLLAFHKTPLTCSDFFGPITRAAISSLIAAVACRALLALIPLAASIIQIIVSTTVFAGVYLAIYGSTRGGRNEARDYLSLLAHLRRSPA